MGDVTSTGTISMHLPQQALVAVIVETPPSADSGDTFKVTLGSYGLKKVIGIEEWIHPSAGNMTAMGNLNLGSPGMSATAVSSGVLTITLGTGTNHQHTYMVVGR